MNRSLNKAYAECEAIARREAKNFYYAFRVLPRYKRAAICAVYAFMRHADDLADDERIARDERLQQTRQWLEEWHRAAAGEISDNPIFIALSDTQKRFQIPIDLLDQLVQGTLMDLTVLPPVGPRSPGAAPQLFENGSHTSQASSPLIIYQDFEELYRYCYFVASVVGLVCIRIFGYSDPRAEKLAEQTGIAFQLTNILRDVREDAERGRIYLPLHDLQQHGVALEGLSSVRGARVLAAEERALMEMEVARARTYYRAADDLLPLIAPDSRAALWVLVKIYRRLLERIAEADYEVLLARVQVPTGEKVRILLRGMWMAFWLRTD